MENFSKLRPPDAIRIKVKIVKKTASLDNPSLAECPHPLQNEQSICFDKKNFEVIQVKKFCVDPQITSYEVLKSLITQAFNIKDEFQMSYLNRDSISPSLSHNLNTSVYSNNSHMHHNNINHEYLSLFNDWDLDAAFLNSSNPYLSITIELKNQNEQVFSQETITSNHIQDDRLLEIYNEWEVINSVEVKNNSNRNNKQQVLSEKPNDFNRSDSSSINTSNKNTLHRSKTYNIMNLDPNGRSLIALWSNTAADKAASVFQKMLNGISRSNSFNSTNLNSKKSDNKSNNGKIINLNQNINSQVRSNSNSITASSNVSTNTSSSASYISLNDQNSQQTNPSNGYTIPAPNILFDINLIEQNLMNKSPLADYEFKNFLDSDGRIVQMQELRQRIFEGGCDPSKRKELWPILLDVYPSTQMTHQERADFIKMKSLEYEKLKDTLWFSSNKALLNNTNHFISDSSFENSSSNSNSNNSHETILYNLAHKIHKDVWRTDRNHKFFAGDSNKNIESLFNILMTYTLAHNDIFNSNTNQKSSAPTTTYAQGMSDLLSPLLFVLRDEALAYICFCSLIKRCIYNFDILSDAITTKINLLSLLLIKYDPEFWSYLKQVGAEQLLFVYRWLLIECKREFPFNDSLRVLEVMWSTITWQQNDDISDEQFLQSNKHSEKQQEYRFGRSNSNASSISLRLLKQINSNEYLNDEYLISNDEDEELNDNNHMNYQNHELSQSRDHISHNSHCHNNNNNNINNNNHNNNNNNNNEQNSICEVCQAESSLSKISESSIQASIGARKDFVEEKEREDHDNDDECSTCNCSIHQETSPCFVTTDSELIHCNFKNSSPNGFGKNGNAQKSPSYRRFSLNLSTSEAKNPQNQPETYVTQRNSSNSSKSSQSAWTSAASASLASSISSCCSTPLLTKKNNQTKTPHLPMPIITITDKDENIITKRAPCEDEEELIYSLSKLDNPFLLFMCLAIFMEHRDHIMKNQLDSNDIACFFDKMIRKHNMKNILNRARYLYTKLYLSKANVFNYIQKLMDIQNSP